MWASIETFCTDESGATAMEYAFIAGFISIASLVAWSAMGNTLNSGYTSISGMMTDAVSGLKSDRTVAETITVLADKSGSPTLR